jgi:hypothetical protein
MALLSEGLSSILQTVYYFLFGWIWGFHRLIAGLVNEPEAVGFGVSAFLLLPIAFHFFIASIAKRLNKQWTFKKSFVTSLLILLIAGAGIATVGGIHEIIWLFGGKEPFTENRSLRHYRAQSSFNLKDLGRGIQSYNDKNEHLPFGGTILDDGQLGHGWITQILPYFKKQELYEKIDFSKSWNDPVNASVFRERVKYPCASPYLRRLPEAEQIDQNGFAKTDYAANQFVLPVGKSLHFDDITDGTSDTILAGETVQNLRAWGSPINARDPKLGINKSPYGFGSKHVKGMNFVLCDGAVKFFSENTDSKILEALATPNGNEPESKEVIK